jgi:hypothetical protein
LKHELIAGIVAALCASFFIGVHVCFLQSNIKYYNKRKLIYNKLNQNNLVQENLPKNIVLRYLTLMFGIDYNQAVNYYFNAMIGRFENSITIFYKLSFKKVKPPYDKKALYSKEQIRFKDFVINYKFFCYFNDLSIQSIENFISAAKLKDYNHKIVMKDGDELYVADLQLIPDSKLSTAQTDLSNYGDSLDLFISHKCTFFVGTNTKLRKLVESYRTFCTENDLHMLNFNENYLRFRYQLHIFKKQITFIQPEENLNPNIPVFVLRTKYF